MLTSLKKSVLLIVSAIGASFPALLLCCLLLFICGCTGGTAAETRTFRLMSYNIHHGEGLDGKVDLERIAELIKREGADIVGLQEVDKGVERTQRRDLGAELAKLTGMTCVFSNNSHHQGGEYGNAVLSRFPITGWTNTHLTSLRQGEQRGVLQVTLKFHGKDLVFMNTHLDQRSDPAERLVSADEIKGLLARVKGKPVVLCGDFNCTPDSGPYAKLAEVFTDAWTVAGEGDGFTIPAKKATKRIDFIWLSKNQPLVPKRLWVPVSDASDHRPVVAELEMP